MKRQSGSHLSKVPPSPDDDSAIRPQTKESVRARLRASVKRLLRKHGYPPDKQAAATDTVIETAEVLCAGWPLEMTA